jgi:hypothetical protein
MIFETARRIPMKVVIQIAAKDNAKAMGILLRHSPGVALRNRVYIVSADAVRALTEAGVRFTELSRESLKPDPKGLVAGERI